MQENEQRLCGELLDYLTGSISEQRRKIFENHLSGCPSCRVEFEELNEVWAAMPLANEEIQVPDELKTEVMRGIFGELPAAYSTAPQPVTAGPVRKRNTRMIFTFAGAAAAAIVLFFALRPMTAEAPAGGGTQTALGPAQIVNGYALHSVDQSMPQAGGDAWVLERDGRNQIVVQLHGLTPTAGDQTYQVWLLRAGTRFNCGTLVTNGQGSGVLTYYINKENLPFDGIGVTLEPDAKGNQPRGKKVLGT